MVCWEAWCLGPLPLKFGSAPTFSATASCLFEIFVTFFLCTIVLCCAFRLIWLLVFLVASALFVYLVTVKFIYLLDHPKNVNVDFNFNASLPFPAVTLCNESPFR